jgi:4-aminobutyrate aminotransferase-like enzyme
VAAVRTIRDEHLLANATEMGNYLGERLDALAARYSIITGTRGIGLMRACDLAEPRAQEIMDRALERGVLITNAGPATIRLIPPLIVQRAEIDEAIAKVDEALAGL